MLSKLYILTQKKQTILLESTLINLDVKYRLRN